MKEPELQPKEMTRRTFVQAGTLASLSSTFSVEARATRMAKERFSPIHFLAPSTDLPNPLIFNSGRRVKSNADWEVRRHEILTTAAEQMYGAAPPRPSLRYELQEEGTAFDGRAKRRQVKLHFASRPNASLNLLLYIPVHIQNPPVIAGLNFWGNHTLSMDPHVFLASRWIESGRNPFIDLSCVQDHHATDACRGIDKHRWPVAHILEKGYGLCTAYRGDIDADLPDESVPGLRSVYPYLQSRGDNFSAIGAWAWALSRMLDYLEVDPTVDHERAAVFGWSRLGKAAVWAGATDQRFAAVLSQESGAGGVKLFRHCAGEDIRRLTTVFPHWYCRNFAHYSGMDCQLPFDQHLILSAIAPRPLFIASAIDDRLSDPPGEFASGILAGSVYRFLGFDALPSESMPPPGVPLIGRVSYQIRLGGHDVTSYDWEQYFKFLQKYL